MLADSAIWSPGFGGDLLRMENYRFDHDRLDAYSLSREAARGVKGLMPGPRSGHGEIVDQLRRASLSVCLNIAEGAGSWLPGEKARFYRTARGSATECAAVLDHMVDLEIAKESDVLPTRQLYARVCATLTKLSISLETKTRMQSPPPNGRGHAPINEPRKR
jgi:four helix bundle protein